MKKFLIIFLILVLCLCFVACSQTGDDIPDKPDTPDIQDDTVTPAAPEGDLLEQELPADVVTAIGDIETVELYECDPMNGGLYMWRRFVEGESAGGRKCMFIYNTNPPDKNNAEVILYDRDHYSVVHSQTDFDSTMEYKHCYYVFDIGGENPGEVYMLLANEKHLKYEDVKGLNNGHHDSGIWVRRVTAKIGACYWVDGTENLTSDKEACQSAVDALKAMTEARHETLMNEGGMEAFQWEYLVPDAEETANYIAHYSGFSDNYGYGIPTIRLVNDFMAIKAEFYVKYTENYYAPSGHGSTFIYMMRDENGEWYVRDWWTPVMKEE